MRSKLSKLVVCFSSMETGHVVVPDNIFTTGRYSTKWQGADKLDYWEPYIEPLPQIEVFEYIIDDIVDGWIIGPKLLTESELISLMEDHTIMKTGRSFIVDARENQTKA